MRAVRLTWTIGGVGLVLCAVMGMLRTPPFGVGSVLGIAAEILFAAAVLWFAIGLSRDASVVARRPLGSVALAVVALWPIVVRVASPFLPTLDATTSEGGLDAYREVENLLTAVFMADLLISVGSAVVAVVQIGRAGTIPPPWQWAPLWALLASLAAALLPQLLFAVAGDQDPRIVTEAAFTLGALGFLARTLGLGIIALLLAARQRGGSVEVLRSG